MKDYSQYFVSGDEKWWQTLERVKLWIDVNKKRPNDKSKNMDEKSIGRWVHRQIHHYKYYDRALKNEKNRKIWKSFVKDYSQYIISDDEKWCNTLERAKIWIDVNKKRPKGNSKNIDEKSIGQWVNKQILCYKNYDRALRDEKKRELWSKFILSYKEIFKRNLKDFIIPD